MDRPKTIRRLTGCYIALPTLFHDADLELNLPGMRRHARFMVDGGLREGNACLLVCGAAGDFTVLSTDERVRIAEAVLEEVGDKVGIILGAQSTNFREVAALAKAAERLGAVAIQLSPPFYHRYTDGDLQDFFTAAAEAADVGVVIYTAYWVCPMSLELIARLVEHPNIVALKLAAPTPFDYEKGVRQFSQKLLVIDNQLMFVPSHMQGARGINTHPCNYWPQWGVKLWGLLESRKYVEAQEEINRVLVPYYDLAFEVERFTGGEGHLDRLCLELVGLDSSRSRPPLRDIRPLFRDKARKMLQACGVPRCK